MATGYTRNDTSNNIANGNVIDADDLDGEFNAVQSAFDVGTGHNHDGTTGGGSAISVIGPSQEYVATNTSLSPKTTTTYDLGSSSLTYQNIYGQNIYGNVTSTGSSTFGTLFADSQREGFSSVTSTSGVADIDCDTANIFSITLTEDTTFTFSNPPSSGTTFGFIVKVVQDSTARTVTWPATVDFGSSISPLVSTDSGAVDIFTFFTHDGGTIWYGFVAGRDMS